MQKTFVKIKTEPIKIETDIKKKKFRSVLKKPHVFCRFDVKMSKVQKRCVEFLFGGVGYGLIEILWRGKTHWTMVLTGGACFVLICVLNSAMKNKKLVFRAASSAALVTAVEFSVGILVNKILNLSIWNYNTMFGNVMGQICPLYSFLWFLLCIPISFVAGKTDI